MDKAWKDRVQKSIKKLDKMLTEPGPSLKANSKPTLLQQAEEFRKQKPMEWIRRKEETEERDKLALGQDKMSPFLRSYHETLRHLDEERRKKREWQKTQPRKVKIMLQYSPTGIKVDPAEAKEIENISVINLHEDNILFGAFKNIVGDDDNQDRGRPELMVTVIKGKYLNNGFQDYKEKAEKCRAVLYMVTPGDSDPHSEKGYYRYVTEKGTTRWEYRFIIRGFTAKQLQKNYFIINLVGKNADKKVNHGQAVLCGTEALIKTPQGTMRFPTEEETEPLERILNNPSSSDTVLMELKQGEVEVPDNSLFKLDLGLGSASPTSSLKRKNKKGLQVKSLMKGGKTKD